MPARKPIRKQTPIEQLEKKMNRAIGERLRAARLLRGLTLTKMSKALGISYQQIQRYEKGGNNITPAKLWSLARIVDVPITYFFGVEETAIKDSRQFSQRLLHLIRRLPGIERDDFDLFIKICKLVMTPRLRR